MRIYSITEVNVGYVQLTDGFGISSVSWCAFYNVSGSLSKLHGFVKVSEASHFPWIMLASLKLLSEPSLGCRMQDMWTGFVHSV